MKWHSQAALSPISHRASSVFVLCPVIHVSHARNWNSNYFSLGQFMECYKGDKVASVNVHVKLLRLGRFGIFLGFHYFLLALQLMLHWGAVFHSSKWSVVVGLCFYLFNALFLLCKWSTTLHTLHLCCIFVTEVWSLFPRIENWFVYGHVHRYSEFLEVSCLFSFVPVFCTLEYFVQISL